MAERDHYCLEQQGRLDNSQNLATGSKGPSADTGALRDDPLPAVFGPKIAEPEGKEVRHCWNAALAPPAALRTFGIHGLILFTMP